MSAESLSILVGSALLELDWLTLEGAVLAFGILQVACGLAWLASLSVRTSQASAVGTGSRSTE